MRWSVYAWGLGALCAVIAVGQVVAQEKPGRDKRKPQEKKEGPAKPAGKQEPGQSEEISPEQKAMIEMMQMMEKLAAPGENHKLLENLAGQWTYQVRHWMDPSKPPEESTGVSSVRAVMGGRYYIGEHKGKMEMPGPDGKPVEREFEGMGITGYDNVKEKFCNAWIDSMGTGIFVSEGRYDVGTKTFTYAGEYEMMPGTKIKVRETIRIIDKDKHVLEWFEDHGGGQEVRIMEITFTRRK